MTGKHYLLPRNTIPVLESYCTPNRLDKLPQEPCHSADSSTPMGASITNARSIPNHRAPEPAISSIDHGHDLALPPTRLSKTRKPPDGGKKPEGRQAAAERQPKPGPVPWLHCASRPRSPLQYHHPSSTSVPDRLLVASQQTSASSSDSGRLTPANTRLPACANIRIPIVTLSPATRITRLGARSTEIDP